MEIKITFMQGDGKERRIFVGEHINGQDPLLYLENHCRYFFSLLGPLIFLPALVAVNHNSVQLDRKGFCIWPSKQNVNDFFFHSQFVVIILLYV